MPILLPLLLSAGWTFPPEMKVVDVKQAFGAVGDGVADDTAALRAAFNQRDAFVFIPDGTYLVRDRLIWDGKPGVGPTVQGQSRDGVVIRLADGSPAFGDPDKPRAVIRTVREGKVSADYFKTKLRNLTVDAGNNRGAVGVLFYANNSGQLRDVTVRGNGVCGVDLSYMLNGPLLVSGLRVDGFGVGIRGGSGPYNSQTLEGVTLRGQRECGLDAGDEAMFVRRLDFAGRCPAVRCRGNFLMTDATLRATGPVEGPAVLVGSGAYLRDVKAEGFGTFLERRPYDRKTKSYGDSTETRTGDVAGSEWWTDMPADGPLPRSLRLPVEETPPLSPPDWSNAVYVDDFGADGADKADDTAAFAAALEAAADRGATTLGLSANGHYVVSGTLPIGGAIARVQGANSYLVPPRGEELRVVVGGGTAETVVFDLLDRPLGKYRVTFANASTRRVVVRSLRADYEITGPGDTFLEDTGNLLRITNPAARVWCRQLNCEQGDRTNVLNGGGDLWVLGLKTEKDQTLIDATGGRTELLGAWAYQIRRDAPAAPLLRVDGGELSAAGVVQWNFRKRFYETLVETVGVDTATLTRESNGSIGIKLWSTRRAAP